MNVLALSLASLILSRNLAGYHSLAMLADPSTLALANVLASINR